MPKMNFKYEMKRRLVNDLSFIYKLLDGSVECLVFLEPISLRVPDRFLIRKDTCEVKFHVANYGKHSVMTS